MRELIDTIPGRIVPAVLTGLGAVLLAAGLLTYTNPVVTAAGPATPSATRAATGTPGLLTLPPASPSAAPSASDGVGRVATRIVIPALRIDLPIVEPPGGDDAYPYCNVAMYLEQLHQPGGTGATYVFAHARTGMFLPLLEESQVHNGQRLLGMLVQVYTSDDQLFLYSISEVRRHQLSIADAVAATDGSLWLQTSEGPKGTKPKLQIVAQFLSSGPADHADAHPTPHPVVCG